MPAWFEGTDGQLFSELSREERKHSGVDPRCLAWGSECVGMPSWAMGVRREGRGGGQSTEATVDFGAGSPDRAHLQGPDDLV